MSRYCVCSGEPCPAALVVRIEGGRAAEIVARLLVMSELQFGLASEIEPIGQVRIARAQPQRVANVREPFRVPSQAHQGVADVGVPACIAG